MRTRHRTFWMRPALVVWAALLAGADLVAAPALRAAAPAAAAKVAGAKPTLVYPHLALPNGGWAQRYSDGFAEVYRHRAGLGLFTASTVWCLRVHKACVWAQSCFTSAQSRCT